jgi:hypothetical protein
VENYEGLPDCLAGKILIDFKAPFKHGKSKSPQAEHPTTPFA